MQHRSNFFRVDSILQQALAVSKAQSLKRLEFISLFPNEYISFWTFAQEIVRSELLASDSLLIFYQSKFPDEYKKSKAGLYMETILNNKIAILNGHTLPDFSFMDTRKQHWKSEKLKGRYLLIQFWAS